MLFACVRPCVFRFVDVRVYVYTRASDLFMFVGLGKMMNVVQVLLHVACCTYVICLMHSYAICYIYVVCCALYVVCCMLVLHHSTRIHISVEIRHIDTFYIFMVRVRLLHAICLIFSAVY